MLLYAPKCEKNNHVLPKQQRKVEKGSGSRIQFRLPFSPYNNRINVQNIQFDNFDYAFIHFKNIKIQSDYFYKILQMYKPEVHVRRRSIETLTTWTLAVKAILVKLFVNSDN